MSGIQFYPLDIETNGLLVGTHAICELSIICATDKMQLTKNVRVPNPENSSLDSLQITGKTKEDLYKGISDQQLIEEFEEFINRDGATPAHRCLVGHNIVNFDRRFLWALWEKYDKQFPVDSYLDTMTVMRARAKKLQLVKPKLTLEASCDLLKVAAKGKWHSAKGDTQNCYFLWEALMKEIDYLDFIKMKPHKSDDLEE